MTESFNVLTEELYGEMTTQTGPVSIEVPYYTFNRDVRIPFVSFPEYITLCQDGQFDIFNSKSPISLYGITNKYLSKSIRHEINELCTDVDNYRIITTYILFQTSFRWIKNYEDFQVTETGFCIRMPYKYSGESTSFYSLFGYVLTDSVIEKNNSINHYSLYNIPEPSVGYKFFDASKKYPVILHIFDSSETSELSENIDMKKMFTDTEFDYGDYSMVPNMVLFRDDVYHMYANISGGTRIEDMAKYDDYVLENTFPCKRLPKTSCFAGKELLVFYNNFYKIRL